MSSKYTREGKATEKWPEIIRLFKPEELMKHMCDWGKDMDPENISATDDFRAEVFRWMCEKLESAPKEELLTAMAETLSAALCHELIKNANKDDDEKEGGWSCLF